MKHHLDMAAHFYAHHPQLSLASISVTSNGEDASVICPRANFMGVADGVSAWSAYALGNSGYLAYYLLFSAKHFAEKGLQHTYYILHNAFEHTWSLYDKKQIQMPNGSTTACIAKLMEDPTSHQPFIQYSNLGDSMIMILRPERLDDNSYNLRIVHQSAKLYATESVQGIPVPLQLCFFPSYGRRGSIEHMEKTETRIVGVDEGDIIIIATDGLWDNLTTDDVLRLTKDSISLNTRLNTKDLAIKLVEAAYKSDIKPDDITAIVGVVRDQGVYL